MPWHMSALFVFDCYSKHFLRRLYIGVTDSNPTGDTGRCQHFFLYCSLVSLKILQLFFCYPRSPTESNAFPVAEDTKHRYVEIDQMLPF